MKNQFLSITCTLRGTERAYTAFLILLVGIPFTEGGTMNYDGYSCIIINIGVMSMGKENSWDETRR